MKTKTSNSSMRNPIFFERWRFSYKLNIIMVGAVKLFQATQKFMRMLGIYPPEPHQSHSFNFKNLSIIFCSICSFFGVFVFFVFQAQTAMEFSVSFYASITILIIIAVFTINIWKAPTIFKLIELVEKFSEKRKLIWFKSAVSHFQSWIH